MWETAPSLFFFLPRCWPPQAVNAGCLPATNSVQSPRETQTPQRKSANETSRISQLTTLISRLVPLSVPIKPGLVAQPVTPSPHCDQRTWKGAGSRANVLRLVSLPSPSPQTSCEELTVSTCCDSTRHCPCPLRPFDSSLQFNKNSLLPGSRQGQRQAGALQSLKQASP